MYVMLCLECYIKFIITESEGEVIISLILHKWAYITNISFSVNEPINHNAIYHYYIVFKSSEVMRHIII